MKLKVTVQHKGKKHDKQYDVVMGTDGTTVRGLKDMIFKDFKDAKPNQMEARFDGKLLDDVRKLTSYNIHKQPDKPVEVTIHAQGEFEEKKVRTAVTR